MRQVLLQSATAFFIAKCDGLLLQSATAFLLQSVTILLQSATGITKCDRTHARGSYQNITTKKVLLEKKTDWLICQGQE